LAIVLDHKHQHPHRRTACHSGASCSAFSSLVMYVAASRSVTSSPPCGDRIGSSKARCQPFVWHQTDQVWGRDAKAARNRPTLNFMRSPATPCARHALCCMEFPRRTLLVLAYLLYLMLENARQFRRRTSNLFN
jgi:hypothetical protein